MADIFIPSKEPYTTIRVKTSTKDMLDTLAINKETYDEIIRRIAKYG